MDVDAIFMSFCNYNSKSDGCRYDFFSFNYSSSLSTSESRAKLRLRSQTPSIVSATPNEVSAIPCELFGNSLRALEFFLQMMYPFKAMNLGAFLALGRQYWGMWPVYFVTSSQCFIRPRNKHKQMVGMGLTD